MTDKTIYDVPSDVEADDGVVSVNGPDAVDVKLSAEAASETSDRLLRASIKARGQKVRGKWKGSANEPGSE
jgi:hypothetical protein